MAVAGDVVELVGVYRTADDAGEVTGLQAAPGAEDPGRDGHR